MQSGLPWKSRLDTGIKPVVENIVELLEATGNEPLLLPMINSLAVSHLVISKNQE
jgi:hypothetical protein